MKIKLKNIVFNYAEGAPHEKAPFLKKPYTSWSAANKAAREMAYYASHDAHGKNFGVDKTDFTATWADGETYQGTLGVGYSMRNDHHPLTDHITSFVRYLSGQKKPEHMSLEHYLSSLDLGQIQEAQRFLEKYDLGEDSPVLVPSPPRGKTSHQEIMEKEEATKAAKQKKLTAYPPPVKDRNEAIAHIKAALQKRSGKQWSVTGGRGTAWGWISISAPPKRLSSGPGSFMTVADHRELHKLLDIETRLSENATHGGQHISIPASSGHYTEYVDRAEGREPRTYGQQYWD